MPTGCVATATAQVMYYWERPTSYNWASMNTASGGGDTPRLMRDVGSVINMDYGCDGSGAYTVDAAAALRNTFGYSNAQYVDYNTSSIRTQLNAQRPIILRGRGVNSSTGVKSGHAWVCDGYRRNKHISIHNPGTYYEYETYTYSPLFLRMNWGWGAGTINTWFRYDDFTPWDNNFNHYRKMIINIY